MERLYCLSMLYCIICIFMYTRYIFHLIWYILHDMQCLFSYIWWLFNNRQCKRVYAYCLQSRHEIAGKKMVFINMYPIEQKSGSVYLC